MTLYYKNLITNMLSCFFTSNYYSNEEKAIEYNNHYLNKNIDDDDACLICWEESEEPLLKINTIIIKRCACNCTMHSSCFLIWTRKTNSCPICRELLEPNPKKEPDEASIHSIYMSLVFENAYETSKNLIRLVAMICAISLFMNITFHILLLQIEWVDRKI